MDKKKIAENLAKFRLRINRGNSLTNIFQHVIRYTAYISIILIAFERYFELEISYEIALLFIPLIFVLYYILGFVDEYYGFWKFENRYKYRELNPHLKKIEDIAEELDV